MCSITDSPSLYSASASGHLPQHIRNFIMPTDEMVRAESAIVRNTGSPLQSPPDQASISESVVERTCVCGPSELWACLRRYIRVPIVIDTRLSVAKVSLGPCIALWNEGDSSLRSALLMCARFSYISRNQQ